MENNMTKTPKKSLLTVLLAFSLLIAQAALFGSASVTHASTGTTLVFAAGSATTNVQGTATAITLQGSGFLASTPGAIKTVKVTFNAAYTAGGATVPVVSNNNVVVANQSTDVNGNIGTTGAGTFVAGGVGAPGAISLTVPAQAPAGTYAIVASDGSNTSAPLYYTVTSPTLTATVVGGYTTTPPSGSNSAAVVPSIPLGGELSLTGTGLNASLPVTFTLVNINGYTDPASGGGPAASPANVVLTVISCPAFGVVGTTCATDINGNVFATVQLPPAVDATYAGQDWAIVASNGTGAGVITKTAGIHIDNTLASVTPSTFSAAPGVPVTITGGGFAPGAALTIKQTIAGVVTTASTTTADSNGRIPSGTTYTVPIGTSAATVTVVVSDAFNNSGSTVIGVNTAAAVTGTLGLSPTTASVGQTITFTATGFVALDVVSVKVSSTSGSCTTTPLVVTTLVANSSGGVNGTFAVPSCVVSVPNSTTGVVATITVTGASNGASASNTIAIRPASASISQTVGTTTNQVTLSGTGFQANENVALTYTPVGGGTVTAGLSNNVTVTADATGSFNTVVTNAYGNVSGYYTVTATGLTSGYTLTATSLVTLGGYLQVPASVVPGQVFVITGTVFAAGSGTVSVNFAPTASPATAITVNASGVFTATITVPTGTTLGSYTVTVSAPVPNASGNQTRTAPISVVALPASKITLGAATGLVGGTVPVTATGYAPNEPISISIQYGATSGLSGTNVPGTPQTFTADNTGSLSTTYTIQSSVAGTLVPGSYNLAVTGVNSGVKNSLPFVVTGSIPVTTTPTNIFFAEGFTGSTASGASANFNETLSILNSNNFTTTYTVAYFKEGATAPISVTGTIGAFSVVQRSVNTDAGAGASVAAEVSSPAPIAAERIIARTTATGTNLGASTSLGQTLNLSATPPASGFDYYFASGSVDLTNEVYLTILNPNATAAAVTINILPQTAISATTTANVAPITETVAATSRLTVPLRKTLLGLGVPVGFAFGLDVNSTLPIAVEKVTYAGDGAGSGKYGSTTVPAGSGSFRQYLFAADFGVSPSTGLNPGAIGTGNDVSEVDIINPGAASNGSATVTVSFFAKNGSPINSQQIQVDGQTRETVAVNDIAGVNPDVFSVVVTSDKNIYVQVPVSFGGDPSKGGTYATENIAGTVPGLTSAAFPYLDGTIGTTALSETVFLYNPGATSITVNAVYSAGTKEVTKSYTVAANSITAVNVDTDAAGLGVTTAIGGFFSVSSSTPGSLVAFAQANTTDYKWAVGTQGTYASSFSSGM
jgi:hypothetical protein